MAGYVVIDDYLGTLSAQVQWRPDADDLVAEVRDHLYTAVERLEVRGVEGRQAELQTLERFGDPELVTIAFVTTPQGGLAMPTSSTRSAGALSLTAAALWLTTMGLWWVAGLIPPWGDVAYDDLGTASGSLYFTGAAALLGAVALTFITFLALYRRHGGLGMVGRVGLIFSGLSVIGAVASYVFMGWGLMLMVAGMLIALAVLDRGEAPRLPVLAIGAAFSLGGVIWLAARGVGGTLLRWGGLWGDYWIVNLSSVTVAAVLLALGLAGIGVWLRGEPVADIADRDEALWV